MVSVEQVMQALEQVMDPEIHRNIVELGMVREVKIKGQAVQVTVALTVPNCPLQSTIAADVERVVTGLGAELQPQVAGKVVTEVLPVPAYFRAETGHQEYFRHNPGQGYCMFVVAPKVEKFRRTFASKRRT